MTIKSLFLLISFVCFSITVSAASFEEGREAYLGKDYEKALSILMPMAKKGHAKAQVTLGIMYDFGHGVGKNSATAIEWYEKAAAQGNSAVQHDLGVKYFRGLGIPQDYDRAAAWWRMAADNGVAESQYNLGLMYARGLGFKKDSGKAIHWYSKAASQGHPHAQYSLGVMYSFGEGIAQNYTKGLAHFQDAAEQDIAQAQYNLAVLLENGRGTDVDLVGAKKWYQRASAAGIEQATERLASLDNNGFSNSSKADPATTQTNQTPKSTPPKEKVAVAAAKKEPATKVVDAKVVETNSTSAASMKLEPSAIKDSTAAPATVKTPDESHQVTSGTVIETASTTEKKVVATINKPSNTAKLDSELKDEDWINLQDPLHYALQMIAFSRKENAQRYIKKLDLEGVKAIYKSTMHGKVIYKVIYGNFDDHRASLRGRRALPPKYRDAKPFPRSFEFVQSEIAELQKQSSNTKTNDATE